MHCRTLPCKELNSVTDINSVKIAVKLHAELPLLLIDKLKNILAVRGIMLLIIYLQLSYPDKLRRTSSQMKFKKEAPDN